MGSPSKVRGGTKIRGSSIRLGNLRCEYEARRQSQVLEKYRKLIRAPLAIPYPKRVGE